MRVICLLSLLLFLSFGYARTYQWNDSTDYADFCCDANREFIIDNRIDTPIFRSIEIDTLHCDFEFNAYIMNIHSSAHSSYEYYDMQGQLQKTISPAWGIYCEMSDGSKYIAKFSNEETGCEFASEVVVKSEVVKISSSFESELMQERQLKRGEMNIYDKDNYLAIGYQNGRLKFKVAKRYEKEIYSFPLEGEIVSVGFVAYPGSKIRISDVQLSVQEDNNCLAYSDWHLSELEDRLKSSVDMIEGYWIYLDRLFDESKLKLGGSYRLAVVGSDQGYDIIYLEGAEINKNEWNPGMLKGELIATEIENVYNVVWYDSEKKPMSKDIKCQIENGNIMTITFPYQKSKIRLCKIEK